MRQENKEQKSSFDDPRAIQWMEVFSEVKKKKLIKETSKIIRPKRKKLWKGVKR